MSEHIKYISRIRIKGDKGEVEIELPQCHFSSWEDQKYTTKRDFIFDKALEVYHQIDPAQYFDEELEDEE